MNMPHHISYCFKWPLSSDSHSPVWTQVMNDCKISFHGPTANRNIEKLKVCFQ